MTPEVAEMLWLAGTLGFVCGVGATLLFVFITCWADDRKVAALIKELDSAIHQARITNESLLAALKARR